MPWRIANNVITDIKWGAITDDLTLGMLTGHSTRIPGITPRMTQLQAIKVSSIQ
uniref:Uncharacterized protein n=1 Tax=Peronospora matthiolae TaxID=2874970 RepID=A0AAV1UVX1_9STRA